METTAKYFRLAVETRTGISSQKWPKVQTLWSITSKLIAKLKTNKI